MIRKLAPVGLAACALLASARPASAFLVVGTDAAQSPGPDTRVLILREGGRNLVAVAPSVRGPAKSVAVVIPLTRAEAETLRTVPITPFERTAKLAAPQMAEVWELDPCELHPDQQQAPSASPSSPAAATAAATASPTATSNAGPAPGAAPVTDGDYEITVLGEAERDNPGKWLTDHGYKVSPDAAKALAEATARDAFLAIARIDGARLTFDKDVARLPPLSFLRSGPLSLPLTLAGRGGAGPHDLVIDVLSPEGRAESVGSINLAVPTNLDATEAAKGNLDGLYRAVLDFGFERTPGAAITEYAWLATSCEGCAPGSGVTAEDLLALGADRLPSAADGTQREVIVDVPESLSRAPEGPPDLKRAAVACYDRTLADMRGLAGDVTVNVKTGDAGAVTEATIQDASAEALGKCITDSLRGLKLDKPGATGQVKATFSLVARAWLGRTVLTRLRVRAGKEAAASLDLRGAAPIEGGREEGPTGEAEQKVRFAEQVNNFHARYVMRHPWAGPVECSEPKYGAWGPKPRNAPADGPRPRPRPASTGAKPRASGSASASPSPTASAKASAPSASGSASASSKPAAPSAAEAALAALLADGTLPDLAAFAIPYRAAEPVKSAASASPSAAPSGSPSAAASASPAPSAASPPPADGGCGCAVPGEGSAPPAAFAISAIAALIALFRRRMQ